ncbi:MAG TPA: methyltransferase domain-containing protein [Dongiaceae bacterium]|nr:methyltransferase domain-containing protein [Dongiaceae bacterium]
MTDANQMFTDGKAYERMMGRWSRRVGDIFLDWLKIPDNLRWLDVGCGNGAFTEEIIARCHPTAVEAVDPSPEQLSYARDRAGTRMAVYHEADAQVLPFDANGFDVAVMALVIAFVPDAAKAVAEMARVVRPGGWVAAYMWDMPEGAPLRPLQRAVKSLGLEPALPPNPTASKLEALQEFWGAAGLVSVETRVISIPVVYADFEDFWTSNIVPIGPLGKLLADMSPDMKARLRQALQEQLPIGADGSIAYEAFANAVMGRMPA